MTTTAPQTPDRAAIEALARTLTDDVWSFVLKEPGSGIHAMAFCQAGIAAGFGEAPSPRELMAALLAFLDEVVAQVIAAGDLDSLAISQFCPWADLKGTRVSLGIIGVDGMCTPLGRAVLRREKEQGR